jgi:nucleotide-binding universal stress UspA family protein
MYTKILVPLDGSRRAERILPYVEELAMKCQSKIVLLQVIERRTDEFAVNPKMAQPSLNLPEKWHEEAETYLSGIKGEFREKGIQARAFVEHGAVVHTILQVAIREAADLIAMASHGRGGLSRVFYGSVAAGVLQQIDRPLLVIRSRQEE